MLTSDCVGQTARYSKLIPDVMIFARKPRPSLPRKLSETSSRRQCAPRRHPPQKPPPAEPGKPRCVRNRDGRRDGQAKPMPDHQKPAANDIGEACEEVEPQDKGHDGPHVDQAEQGRSTRYQRQQPKGYGRYTGDVMRFHVCISLRANRTSCTSSRRIPSGTMSKLREPRLHRMAMP